MGGGTFWGGEYGGGGALYFGGGASYFGGGWKDAMGGGCCMYICRSETQLLLCCLPVIELCFCETVASYV